jgi:hypothetical protein
LKVTLESGGELKVDRRPTSLQGVRILVVD